LGALVKLVAKTKRFKKKKKQKKRKSFFKRKLFFSGLALFSGLTLFCFWEKTIVLGKKDEAVIQIFISEIMFNPLGKSEKGKEWIEIYFPHEAEIESKDKKDGKFIFPLEVCYKAKEEKGRIECEKSAEIFFEKQTIRAKKGEYWLIVQDKKDFCQEYFGSKDEKEECLEGKKGGIMESSFTLYNASQNFVGILWLPEEADKNGNEEEKKENDEETEEKKEEDQKKEEIFLDYCFYKNSWAEEGFSLEKKKILENGGQELWRQSFLQGGTPFKEFEKINYSRQIFLNEIMPNPSGLDKDNEWIELINFSNEKVDLKNWYFENGKGSQFRIKEGVEILPFGFLVTIISSGSFSIRNSKEKVALFDPGGELVDEAGWQELAPSGLSFNKKETGDWEWSRFVTPGKENRFNHLPKVKTKIDSKIYRNIPAQFSAAGTKDKDGDELKFVWDFGDGHRSYQKETVHSYDEKGKYTVKLFVKDGSAVVEKQFKIEVKSYPRRQLKIVEIEPNPKGKDKGNERIVIENRSSKRVNLLDFLIATGKNSQKTTNHPIYDDFYIAPGKTKEIKNEKICYFSLLNSRGVVKLLYPDKKKADVLKYEKDKIGEGEVYRLTENGWNWIKTITEALSQGGQEPEGTALAANKSENEGEPRKNILVLGTMSEKTRLV